MAIPAVFAVFAGKQQRRLTFPPQESWTFRASVNQRTASRRRGACALRNWTYRKRLRSHLPLSHNSVNLSIKDKPWFSLWRVSE
jgi:hypothetical protein